jgi:uncharacterized protein YkwD
MRRELHRVLGVFVAVLLAVAFGLATNAGLGAANAACDTNPCVPAPDAPGGQDAAGAGQLLALANADRSANGVPPLVARDDVTSIAIEFSKRMVAAGDIFHNDDYFSSASHTRLDAKSLGENVAMNRDIVDAHTRLMASPGHRANLLDPKFSVVGIGVVRDGRGIAFITEDFIQPKSAIGVVTAAPAPTVQPGPAPTTPPAPQPAPAPGAPTRPLAPTPAPQPEVGASNGEGAAAGGDPARAVASVAPVAPSIPPEAVGAAPPGASTANSQATEASGPAELAAGAGDRQVPGQPRRVSIVMLALGLTAVAANLVWLAKVRRRSTSG